MNISKPITALIIYCGAVLFAATAVTADETIRPQARGWIMFSSSERDAHVWISQRDNGVVLSENWGDGNIHQAGVLPGVKLSDIRQLPNGQTVHIPYCRPAGDCQAGQGSVTEDVLFSWSNNQELQVGLRGGLILQELP